MTRGLVAALACVTSISVISAGMVSCKERNDSSGLQAADANALNAIADHLPPANSGLLDALSINQRRAHMFPGQCGQEQSKIRLFKTGLADRWAWFDEARFRKIASPAYRGVCKAGETLDTANQFCWGDFGLQMYPVAKSPQADHYLVSGASPVIRVIPASTYPASAAACKFDNDTAMIFVSGISNPGLGESWRGIDGELLASILAWNRTTPHSVQNGPGGMFEQKLQEIPGYIQIVGNTGGLMGGVFGNHDDNAIERVAKNLELAYRSGVSKLEIVSHSNGMISSQIGLTEFAKSLASNAGAWKQERDANNPAAGRMQLQMYHLQAAPSQKWSYTALDRYKSYSDFLPNAVWVKRSKLGVPYWGWDWDFSVYKTIDQHADLAIDFFYNASDGWTYSWAASVGRVFSTRWHNEVKDQGYSRGIKPMISHHLCKSSDPSECGPPHLQRDTLWDFPNPGFRNGLNPIDWETDLVSGSRPSRVVAAMPSASPMGQESANAVLFAEGSLPQVICLNVQTHPSMCTRIFDPNNPRSQIAASQNPGQPTIPTVICSAVNDTNSPCNTSVCGDGICGLGEQGCVKDCKLPTAYTSCVCENGDCRENLIKCAGGICTPNEAVAKSSCSCANNLAVQCDRSDVFCEILTIGSRCSKTAQAEPVADDGLSLQNNWTSKITEPNVPRP